jgi:hypothetical protein
MSHKAFVIMPFGGSFDAIYNLFIAPILTEIGYEVFRADDICHQRNILQDVIEAIIDSNLIIADLTGCNPNVFYELGIAHAMEKSVILLTQSIDELPFDLRSYRVILYNPLFSEIENAKQSLRQTAGEAYAGRLLFSNPYVDYKHNSTIQLQIPEVVPSAIKTEIVPIPIPTSAQVIEPEVSGEQYILNLLVNVEDGFTNVSELLKRFAIKTNEITQNNKDATVKITTLSENRPMDYTKQLLLLTQELGRKQQSYAEELKSINLEYRSAISLLENGIEVFLISKYSGEDDERRQLENAIRKFGELKENSNIGIEAFGGMLGALENVPRIERSFNTAIDRTKYQVREFIENTRKIISITDRMTSMIESKMNPPSRPTSA